MVTELLKVRILLWAALQSKQAVTSIRKQAATKNKLVGEQAGHNPTVQGSPNPRGQCL